MWDEIKDLGGLLLLAVVTTLLLIALIAVPIIGINAIVGNNKCDDLSMADDTHEYKYTLWTGCRVRTSSGYWILSDSPALVELELQQGE